MPKSCLKEIQKNQRNFILGEWDDKRHIHDVNWNAITKPKNEGGLGLRKLSEMNKACLAKLSWKMSKGGEQL